MKTLYLNLTKMFTTNIDLHLNDFKEYTYFIKRTLDKHVSVLTYVTKHILYSNNQPTLFLKFTMN